MDYNGPVPPWYVRLGYWWVDVLCVLKGHKFKKINTDDELYYECQRCGVCS